MMPLQYKVDMIMGRMTDKIALVVGGAKGIGRAIAERLVAEGATVYLTGRQSADVEHAAKDIGHGARGLVADASNAEDLAQVVQTIRQEHGHLDALVLNAGISEPASLDKMTTNHFDRLFSVNVKGLVFGFQAAVPLMREGGSVVLMGSVAGSAGIADYATYGATKAAVRAYARTWTAELVSRGIRVNVLAPASTDTGMMAAVPDDVRAAIVATIPMGRMARPSEVASAALFLLSNEASFIAGVELFVDGGMQQV